VKFFLSLLILFSLGSCKVDPSNSSSNPPGIVSKFFENDHFIVERYKESSEQSYVRVMMKSGKVSLTNADLLTLLAQEKEDGKDLREALTKTIANLEGKGIQLKSAVITLANKADPYYFLAVLDETFPPKLADTYKDYFFHCDKKPVAAVNTSKDYTERFIETFGFDRTKKLQRINKGSTSIEVLSNGASHFLSTSGTPLVSPCPFENDLNTQKNKSLVHLKAYMEAIKDDAKRQLSFWSAVSSVAKAKLDKNEQVLLNTEGHAVDYLHFRVESKTGFYSSCMDLTDVAKAKATYDRVFKEPHN